GAGLNYSQDLSPILLNFGSSLNLGTKLGDTTNASSALDKGKPGGSRGRKATGPSLVNDDGKASRAAWRTPVIAEARRGARPTLATSNCNHLSQGEPFTCCKHCASGFTTMRKASPSS